MKEDIELRIKELRGEMVTSVNKFNSETGLKVTGVTLKYYEPTHEQPNPELKTVYIEMMNR